MAISAVFPNSLSSSISAFEPASTSGVKSSLSKTLQSLQKNLASGDLPSAKDAFAKVQQLNKNLSKSASIVDAQLTTDIVALGTALGKGDLPSARSALSTVQKDVLSSNARAISAAATLASNTAQQIDAILGTFSSGGNSSTASPFGGSPATTSTIADQTTSYLSKVYGSSAVPTSATGIKVNVSA